MMVRDSLLNPTYWFAQLLSIVFHPLFMLTYGFFLFIAINPYLFPYYGTKQTEILALVVFFTSCVIPGISILLMYGIGLVDSIQLETNKERIGPLIVASITYLWLYLNIRTHNAIPAAYTSFVLGSIVALFIAFFINNFSKISLHAVGLGGLLMAFLMVVLRHGSTYLGLQFSGVQYSIHSIMMLAIIGIIIGAVLSSRIYLGAHKVEDVFGGLLVGVFGQIISAFLQ